MNERLVPYTFSLVDPAEATAITTGACYFMVPFEATLVYASVAPFEDDSGATMDILDDGVDIVTGISAADHDVPGEWAATGYGGTNDPVSIAAGSEISIDINNGAAANRFDIQLLFLAGEKWG